MWAILALASALFESVALLLEKKALLKEHAMEYCSAMSLFAMLVSIPLWLMTDVSALALDAVAWIFASSLSFSLALLFFAKALRHMAVSYTAPFFSIGPLIAALFASFFLGENLNLVQWGGVIVVMLGAYLLYSHSHKDLLDPIRHMFKVSHLKFVWLGLIFYAIAQVIDKWVVGASGLHVPVLSYLALFFFFVGVIFILMMLLFHDGFHGIGNGMKNNTKWLLAIALLTIAYRGLLLSAMAVPGVLLAMVITIKKMSALFSTVVGGEMFHEKHMLRKTIACVIMICGAILVLL